MISSYFENKGVIQLIQITKQERAIIYKAYPHLSVPRTASGKYWLCEEEQYLRLIPENHSAAQILNKIDRRRERLKEVISHDLK